MANKLPPLPDARDMDYARWGYDADDMHNHAVDAFAAGVESEKARSQALRTVACQVLRDMQAQGVLIEWQTVLAEALGERPE